MSLTLRFAAFACALYVCLTIVGCRGGDRGVETDSGPQVAAWARDVPAAQASNAYCGKCHQAAEDAWRTSHHSKANRPVSPIADAAMFAERTAETHAARYEFTRDPADGAPVIRELLREGAARTYRPSMVVARTPLWQYLVETEPGRFQTTEVAWDPEREEWFGVFGMEERNPGEWGHWHGRGMNWNSMCARCHMTAYSKNYDAATDTYSSRWIEHGIGCVQCHNLLPGHEPGGAAMATVDDFARDPTRMMETCAACHSRAESLTRDFVPGEKYDDHFRLQLPVEPSLYYADGQILDEVFVYGSFRHSKMHAAGVTCMDCHDPHAGTLKLPQENNHVCLQCHAAPGRLGATVIDPVAHSFHKEGSEGNRCVECHMAETTYMQRDPRRDHGFIVPDPVLTRDIGVPNACSKCHDDQTLEWNIEHYEKWYGAKRAASPDRARARAIDRAFRGDAEVVPELVRLLDAEAVPARRASLLELAARIAPEDESVRARARTLASDPDALVRAASVRAAAAGRSDADVVRAALDDPARLVRIDAAWASSPSLPEGSERRHELDTYLREALDQPAGRLRVAQDLFNRGRSAEAVDLVRSALPWDPLSPALPETLGLVLAQQGRATEAAQALQRAAELDTRSAGLAFQAALAWSEAGDMARAEAMFGAALRAEPGLARAWYNLGLLQARTGRAQEAVISLREAERLRPDDPDAPYALATVYLGLGRRDEAEAAARRVLELAPGHAPATRLLRQVGAVP
jgi:tetratricopeptide (TPR) repeat protein